MKVKENSKINCCFTKASTTVTQIQSVTVLVANSRGVFEDATLHFGPDALPSFDRMSY